MTTTNSTSGNDKNIDQLIAERKELTFALSLCGGGFPGSAAHKKETEAMMALQRFDDAHPEVIVAINAAHSTRVASENPTGYQN